MKWVEQWIFQHTLVSVEVYSNWNRTDSRSYLEKLKNNYMQFKSSESHLSLNKMMVKYYGMHLGKMFLWIKSFFLLWYLCWLVHYQFNFDLYFWKNLLGMRIINLLKWCHPKKLKTVKCFLTTYLQLMKQKTGK